MTELTIGILLGLLLGALSGGRFTVPRVSGYHPHQPTSKPKGPAPPPPPVGRTRAVMHGPNYNPLPPEAVKPPPPPAPPPKRYAP